MLLAVKKGSSGSNPMGGYHYMLHPVVLESEFYAAFFRRIGYVVIEVDEERGQRLLAAAVAALNHQIEVAGLTEAELGKPQVAKEKS